MAGKGVKMVQALPAHGDVRAEIRGRVLVVEAFWIWNAEMYRQNLNQLQED